MPSPYTSPADYFSACPRCGKSCRVGAHESANCSGCFTSFRADDPGACLTPTASERIRLARRAQLVAHYEKHGYPLALVRLLNSSPLVSLSEALDGFAIPARKVA